MLSGQSSIKHRAQERRVHNTIHDGSNVPNIANNDAVTPTNDAPHVGLKATNNPPPKEVGEMGLQRVVQML